jgi:hypothetical protein
MSSTGGPTAQTGRRCALCPSFSRPDFSRAAAPVVHIPFLFYVSSGLQHVKQRLVIVKDRSRELGRIEQISIQQVGLATD